MNPDDRKRIGGTHAWRGTHGLAADVRFYGQLIRDRAREKIGQLYPRVRLPKTHGGGEATPCVRTNGGQSADVTLAAPHNAL